MGGKRWIEECASTVFMITPASVPVLNFYAKQIGPGKKLKNYICTA
jgi:hypothetical protein